MHLYLFHKSIYYNSNNLFIGQLKRFFFIFSKLIWTELMRNSLYQILSLLLLPLDNLT